MTQQTLLIDLERCVGCYTCKVACKQENRLSTDVSRNEVFEIGPVGTYPELKGYFLPLTCMHCKNPPCVGVCPTGASYRREDGIVLINHDDCVLCERCINACPYGARSMSFINHRIESCNLCAHRIDEGKLPACVSHCIGQALIFGDSSNSQSELSKYINKNMERKIRSLEEQPAHPAVIYLSPKCGILFETKDIFLKRYKKVEKKKETSRKKLYKDLIYLTWARRNTFVLLSRIWGEEIDEPLLNCLKNISLHKFQVFPELENVYRELEEILKEKTKDDLQDFAIDYFNILQNISPYESVYRSPDGLMMQEEWEKVVQFYFNVGIRPSEEVKESEDHIAIELECMGYLCGRMLQELKAERFKEARILLSQQNELLDGYIMKWVPSMMDKVTKLAKTDFYRAMAITTIEILKLDCRILKKISLLNYF